MLGNAGAMGDYRVVETVLAPAATLRTLKSFVVKDGQVGSIVTTR